MRLRNLAGILFIAGAFLFAGCSEEEGHKHSFSSEWSSDESTHWYECAVCGEVKDLAAHIEKSALMKDGSGHWKVCYKCDAEYGKAEHIWNHEDYQYNSVFEKEIKICTVCSYIADKNHEHTEDAGTVTTVTTCLANGVKTFKCTVCKAVVRTEEIAKMEHTWHAEIDTTEDCIKTVCSACSEIEKVKLYSFPENEDGTKATSGSTYVNFGVFPKDVLPEKSSVTVDETVSVTIGANTYYKGSDGNYYAKVTAKILASYCYSDYSMQKNGVVRYFKVEPIKWKVLTNDYHGKSLLLAEEILTGNVPYCVRTGSSFINKKTVWPNNYRYSTIRAYLNGKYETGDDYQTKKYYDTTNNKGIGFLQTAFTAAAQNLIADTLVDNSAETTGHSESTYATDCACENTTDKIFLLSVSEVINSEYGFTAYDDRGVGNSRTRFPTDYAQANYAHIYNDTYGGNWWLRSPHTYRYSARYVYDRGGVESSGGYSVDDESFGVVPALCLSLEKY